MGTCYYKQHSEFQTSQAFELLQRLSFSGDESILDIGCGFGMISKWMAGRVSKKGKVIGIDPSQKMLAQAMLDYGNISNLDFYCERAETFAFDEKFNLITSFYALHFVKNHKLVFQRMKEALASQGRILIRMMSKIPPVFAEVFNQERWQTLFSFRDIHTSLSKKEAESILIDLGFQIFEVDDKLGTYTFFSREQLIDWLKGWLCYYTKDHEDELAIEIADLICQKNKTNSPITVQHCPLTLLARVE